MQAAFGTVLFLLVVACILALHYRSVIKTLNAEKINLCCLLSDRDQKIVELQEHQNKVLNQLCMINYKIKNDPKFKMGDAIGKFMIIGDPVVQMAFKNELQRFATVACLAIFNPKYKSPQSFSDILRNNPLCHYVYPVQTDLLKKPFKISETQLILLQTKLNKS